MATDLPGCTGADHAEGGGQRPLAGYAALGAGLAGALLAARRAGRPLPPRLALGDVVIAGLATQKLSRIVSKDKVTSHLRAPFTGSGVAQWIAAGFTVGHVYAPRATRLLARMWAVYAVADAAQLAYAMAEDRA